MEEWKIIPSHPSYAASNLGRIKRVVPDKLGRGAGYILGIRKDRAGYSTTTLTTNGREWTVRVGVMVCEAFHGHRLPKMEAGHINGVKDDDRSDNLRWVTREENEADKRLHGTIYGGESHWTKREGARERWNLRTSKLSDDQVREIYKDKRIGRVVAATYGISQQAVSAIRCGKSWRHITSRLGVITSD